MKSEIEQIKSYIDYLKRYHNLNITVHSKDSAFLNVIYMLPDINIHSEAYCTYVKSFPEMWDKCILNQNKIYKKLEENNNEMFFGSCYAGVGEFIVPICRGGDCCGFISVGKYRGSKGKMLHMSNTFKIPKDELEKEFETDLSPELPDFSLIEALIYPLCAMIAAAADKRPAQLYSENENTVKNALVFIHRNFSAAINLSAAARFCHCSPRNLSGLFKKATGLTVGEYIEELKMKNAKKLLSDSELPITDIAFLCGYSDSNYFTLRFRRFAGVPPTEYRKRQKNSKK